MKYSSRFFLYAPVAAFALILAAIIGHWFWASHLLSQRLDALNGQQVMPGVTLRFAQKEMAGFPFRLDAVFKDLDITIETRKGLARWKSEQFAFHSLTYGSVQQVFEAAGKQSISWTGEKDDARHFEFVPGSLRGSAVEGDDGVQRFDLDLIDLGSSSLAAGHVQFHIRKDGDGLQFVATLEAAQLSEKQTSAFGDVIRTLRLEGSLSHGASFDGLRAGRTDWRSALEDWRTHGGTLQLSKGDLSWTRSTMQATGALSLDDQRRLKGSLHLDVSGMDAIADEAAKRNIVKGANQGLVAGLLDQVMPKPGQVSTALAFKDGLAYVEQTPVATLDTLY
jgi:hypothetical protein